MRIDEPFEVRQFLEANKRVHHRWGPGYHLIGDEIKTALIKAEVLSIIAANESFSDNPLVKLASYAMVQLNSEGDPNG